MLINFIKDTMLKGKRVKANTTLEVKDSDGRIFIATGLGVPATSNAAPVKEEIKPEAITEVVKPVKTKKSK